MRGLRSGARRLRRWLGVALLATALWWLWTEGRWRIDPPIRTGAGESVRVIDGDSLEIGARRLRLLGYDAPERDQTCTTAGGQAWPCGKAARARLEALLASGDLACADRGRDRYGRTLALCRVGRGEIGALMVRDGLGLRLRSARDARYRAEEDAARLAGRGVWQGPHQHPADWRDAHRSDAD